MNHILLAHQIHRTMHRSLKQHTNIRYLFLDFDGVVNVPPEPDTEEFQQAVAANQFEFFRPEIAERVGRLCLDYDLSIVIASSWRFLGIDACMQKLYDSGMDRSVKNAGTTQEEDAPREQEIANYLQEHPDYEAFLILDDLPMTYLKPWALHIVSEKGYTEADDRKARKLLSHMLRQHH